MNINDISIANLKKIANEERSKRIETARQSGDYYRAISYSYHERMCPLVPRKPTDNKGEK
jgi:hypothetical protein